MPKSLQQTFRTPGHLVTNHRPLLVCPHCALPFAEAPPAPFARQRCAGCGFTQHRNPAPGITLLLHSPAGKVLVGKRTESARYGGQWCLPGGYIEEEETFIDTAHREALEETGLDIALQGIINIVSNHLAPGHHTLVIVLLGVVVGGRQAAGDDLMELRWIDRHEHQGLAYAFEADQRIIDGFFAGDLHLLPIDRQAEARWATMQREPRDL